MELREGCIMPEPGYMMVPVWESMPWGASRWTHQRAQLELKTGVLQLRQLELVDSRPRHLRFSSSSSSSSSITAYASYMNLT